MIHPDMCPICGREPPERSWRTAQLAVLTVSCPACAGPLERETRPRPVVVVTPAEVVLARLERELAAVESPGQAA